MTDSEGNVDITITDSCISKEEQANLEIRFYKDDGGNIVSVGADVDLTTVTTSSVIEVTPSTNNVAMFRRSHVASKSATLIKHLDETDADYASNISSFQEALVTFEEFVATKFNSGNQYSQRIPKPTGVSAEKFDVAIEQYGAATLATKFTELSIDPDTDTEIVALNSRIEGVVNNVSVRENTELDDIYDLRDENNNPIPNEFRFQL